MTRFIVGSITIAFYCNSTLGFSLAVVFMAVLTVVKSGLLQVRRNIFTVMFMGESIFDLPSSCK